MTTDTAAAKARAEALFRPSTSAEAGRQDQSAAQDAQAENTAKLRALRLAKEESDRIAAELRRARREQQRP